MPIDKNIDQAVFTFDTTMLFFFNDQIATNRTLSCPTEQVHSIFVWNTLYLGLQ